MRACYWDGSRSGIKAENKTHLPMLGLQAGNLVKEVGKFLLQWCVPLAANVRLPGCAVALHLVVVDLDDVCATNIAAIAVRG